MVSSTLCPTVHILGSQNVYGRAEGIAGHYWPWAVFFFLILYTVELCSKGPDRKGSPPIRDLNSH